MYSSSDGGHLTSVHRSVETTKQQREFEAQTGTDVSELLRDLRATVEGGDRVLANVDQSALLERRRIQSHDVTVMQAIYAVVEHFSMHTGQIILLAKTFKGDLGFYDLSDGEPRPTWKGGMAGH